MAKDWKEYERTIAKSLGAWWGCIFRRTPSSGAWGKQGQSRFSQGHDAAADFHGDIVAPPEAQFPFSVECKTYKSVELYLSLYGSSPVFDWWLQCQQDAKRVGKVPLLVFKENGKKPLMAVSDKTWNTLCDAIDDLVNLNVMRLRFTHVHHVKKKTKQMRKFRGKMTPVLKIVSTTKSTRSIVIVQLQAFLDVCPSPLVKHCMK